MSLQNVVGSALDHPLRRCAGHRQLSGNNQPHDVEQDRAGAALPVLCPLCPIQVKIPGVIPAAATSFAGIQFQMELLGVPKPGLV